jgi:hypothetical protein
MEYWETACCKNVKKVAMEIHIAGYHYERERQRSTGENRFSAYWDCAFHPPSPPSPCPVESASPALHTTANNRADG